MRRTGRCGEGRSEDIRLPSTLFREKPGKNNKKEEHNLDSLTISFKHYNCRAYHHLYSGGSRLVSMRG